MNCNEFQSRLDLAVEERRSPEESVQSHGAGCPNPECQLAWADFRLLEAALSAWKRPVATIDFVDRILAQVPGVPVGSAVTQDGSRRRTRLWGRRFRGRIVLAPVVAVCALLVTGRGFWTGDSNSPTAPTVQSEGFQELGTLYISWVEGASSGVTESVASVLAPPALDHVTESTGEESWLQHWGKQLKPLEEELNQTFRVFTGDPPGEASSNLSPTTGPIT